MPYKDPEVQRAWMRANRSGYNAKRDRALRKLARALRRALRSMTPERYQAVRALLTKEEAEVFDAITLSPTSAGVRRRARR